MKYSIPFQFLNKFTMIVILVSFTAAWTAPAFGCTNRDRKKVPEIELPNFDKWCATIEIRRKMLDTLEDPRSGERALHLYEYANAIGQIAKLSNGKVNLSKKNPFRKHLNRNLKWFGSTAAIELTESKSKLPRFFVGYELKNSTLLVIDLRWDDKKLKTVKTSERIKLQGSTNDYTVELQHSLDFNTLEIVMLPISGASSAIKFYNHSSKNLEIVFKQFSVLLDIKIEDNTKENAGGEVSQSDDIGNSGQGQSCFEVKQSSTGANPCLRVGPSYGENESCSGSQGLDAGTKVQMLASDTERPRWIRVKVVESNRQYQGGWINMASLKESNCEFSYAPE